jgi:DNA repair ATPase RecN
MSDNHGDHYQGALLEDINDKLSGIAEAVGGLSDKVDGIDDRLGRVEETTQSIDRRLNHVEGRLDRVDGRLNQVEGRLHRVEKDTELLPIIRDAVTAQSADLDDHEIRLKQLERRHAA